MEEKGTDTNKNKSNSKANSNLFLFDENYHKVKAQQKLSRCKSANIRKQFSFHSNINISEKKNEKEKDNNINSRRYNFFSNDLLRRQKKNTIDAPIISAKNRNKLSYNIKTINLANILRQNESLKLESTKQSSRTFRARLISGKSNMSYSFHNVNNSNPKERKKSFYLKNKQISVINFNADKCQKKQENFNKKTLKDITTQKLIKKSKLIELDKMVNKNKNLEKMQNARILDLYPNLLNYLINKTKRNNNKIDKLIQTNDSGNIDNSRLNNKVNFPIKYSFFDDTINNIQHMVNFVDMENREELIQNVTNDLRNINNYKFEDFKTYGYELNPEILYKINQDEKHKLIKIQYEKLKKNNFLKNTQEIKAKKYPRPIFKKNYIPEFKLKLNNQIWKEKLLETKNRNNSYKNLLTPKANTIKRKKIIKRHIASNLKKGSTMKYYSVKSNFLENKFYEQNNKKYNSLKIHSYIENKKIKSVLKNSSENEKNNYINNLINNNNDSIRNNDQNIISNDNINNAPNNADNSKTNINDITEKKSEEIENNEDNKVNSSSDNKRKVSESNEDNDLNIENIYNIDNHHINNKDYNKINKIVKVGNITIFGNEGFKFDNLDISESIIKINSKRNYQKRHTFNFSRNNNNIDGINNKNIKRKTLDNTKAFSTIGYNVLLNKNFSNNIISNIFGNLDIVKLNKESITSININKNKEKSENIQKEDSIDDEIDRIFAKKEEIKKENEEITEEKEILNEEDKEIEESENNENQKDFLENYEKFGEQMKLNKGNKKKFTPFYKSEKKITTSNDKIEINFIGIKSKNLFKKKPKIKPKKREIKKKVKEDKRKEKIDEILKAKNIEKEEEKEEIVQKLEEKILIMKGRRMNKSSTLEYINKKYNEIESKKGNININQEINKNLEKLPNFKNIDLDSVEDIEYNKSVLLYKLREDIKYKIKVGKCDKSDMDDFINFEKKLNEYKVSYNLKDKNKIKEYILLLLIKINEFIELLEVRERRKVEENRINKFVNDLNYELDFNLPMSIIVRGRRCFSRNYNEKTSSLSEINK